MSDKTFTHAFYINGQFVLSDDGDIELPTPTALAHRLSMVDGEVHDAYGDVDDDAVRFKDWQDGVDFALSAGDEPPPDYRGDSGE